MFGAYVYSQEQFILTLGIYGTIPIICFSFIIFMANIGIMSLPFLILVELLPLEVSIN